MKSKIDKPIEMPNYTRVGFDARHPWSKPQNRDENKIKTMEPNIKCYGHPGTGYRPENDPAAKNPSRGNKITVMAHVNKTTFGVPKTGVKGKMNNDSDSGSHYNK